MRLNSFGYAKFTFIAIELFRFRLSSYLEIKVETQNNYAKE
jgi:hypothetical protein